MQLNKSESQSWNNKNDYYHYVKGRGAMMIWIQDMFYH